MNKSYFSIAAIALGALVFLASLTADMTGLGDDGALSPMQTFGPYQMAGTVVGLVVLTIGIYQYRKRGAGKTSGD